MGIMKMGYGEYGIWIEYGNGDMENMEVECGHENGRYGDYDNGV